MPEHPNMPEETGEMTQQAYNEIVKVRRDKLKARTRSSSQNTRRPIIPPRRKPGSPTCRRASLAKLCAWPAA